MQTVPNNFAFRAFRSVTKFALVALMPIHLALADFGDPPDCNAGPDQMIEAPSGTAAVILDGSMTVGYDGPITYVWEDITNPIFPVILSTSTSATANVTLSGLFVHTIRLATTDENGTSYDTVAISLNAGACTVNLVQPAANQTVECDGLGDNVALEAWLDSNGGAQATSANGPVTWTNDYNKANWVFPDPGCATGHVVVNFLATVADGCFVGTTAKFSVVDTTAPTLVWKINGVEVNDSGTYTVQPKNFPIVVTITPVDLCGGATLTKQTWQTIDGCVGKTYAPQSFTITSGTVGATIKLCAKAKDCCNNLSATEFILIDVISNGCGNTKAKGNEGLGNGPDGNTPGHYHNGGNDDPRYSPGNPGARNKRR